MSEQKRQELIEAGLLNPDGSRKARCPTCQTAVGESLTEEAYEKYCAPGHAVAEINSHEVAVESPEV